MMNAYPLIVGKNMKKMTIFLNLLKSTFFKEKQIQTWKFSEVVIRRVVLWNWVEKLPIQLFKSKSVYIFMIGIK